MTRRVLAGVGVSSIVFTLLLVVDPGISRSYAPVFRGLVQASVSLTRRTVDVRAKPGRPRRADTVVDIEIPRNGSIWRVECSSWFFAYLPLAVFFSAMSSTWSKPRRLLRSACIGLIAVHGYILLRLALWLLYSRMQLLGRQPLHADSWLTEEGWRRIIGNAYGVLHLEPSLYVGVPLAVCLFSSFRPFEAWASPGQMQVSD